MEQLTLFAEGSPARISQWPESEQDWQEIEAASFGRLLGLQEKRGRVGWYSKTCQAYYLQIRDATSESSSKRWENSGMAYRGVCLTRKTSESPNEGVASLLSDILEDHAHPKYYLSPKACSGILRRAEKRGKELPEALHRALRATLKDSG